MSPVVSCSHVENMDGLAHRGVLRDAEPSPQPCATVATAWRAMGGTSIRVSGLARWSPLAVRRHLLLLVDTLVPAGASADLAIDETLERRWGGTIRTRGHDRERFVSCPGLRWIVMAVVVTLPQAPGRHGPCRSCVCWRQSPRCVSDWVRGTQRWPCGPIRWSAWSGAGCPTATVSSPDHSDGGRTLSQPEGAHRVQVVVPCAHRVLSRPARHEEFDAVLEWFGPTSPSGGARADAGLCDTDPSGHATRPGVCS